MKTQIQTKPSVVNLVNWDDIIYLLWESEENYKKKGWISIQESYKKNKKRLSYIFN